MGLPFLDKFAGKERKNSKEEREMMEDEMFEGVNETSTADLSTEETIDNGNEVDTYDTAPEGSADDVESASTEEVTSTEEENVQSATENAKYAAARRQAEAEYKQAKARSDAEAKRLFGNYKHPDTGKPIETWEEYASAIEAQQRHQTEQRMIDKGVSPEDINNLIENSPTMRQAKEVIAEQQKAESQRRIDDDVKAISKIDPSVKTLDDILKMDNSQEVVDLVTNNNLSLVQAYKLVNSDRLSAMASAATKQAAINSAKSTTHLETTRGVKKDTASYEPIPEAVLGHWKDAYPGLSIQELTKKYNSVL